MGFNSGFKGLTTTHRDPQKKTPVFLEQWIRQSGPTSPSPDSEPSIFISGGHLNSTLYATDVDEVQDLYQRIQNGFKNYAVLCYDSASSGNFSPTFRDNLSVPSSVFKDPEGKHGSESLCSGNIFSCILVLCYRL